MISILMKFIRHKSFQNFVIICSIAVIQLVNNVILGRCLTPSDFGVYSLIFLTIIRLTSFVFLFGQNASIIRYFSSKNITDYNWQRYLVKYFSITIPIVIIATFIIIRSYDLSTFWVIVAVPGILMMCFTNILSSFLKSDRKFNIAVFTQQSNAILFFIILCVLLSMSFGLDLLSIAMAKLVSMLLVAVFFCYFIKKYKNGKQQVKSTIYKEGFVLWELSVTIIALASVNGFVIAKVFDYKTLALYSVIITIMQIYEFAATSLTNIYTQRFASKERINLKKILAYILGLVIVMTIFYMFFTETILSVLFKGKYVASALLIFLFALYGSLRVMYVIPSCYIVGCSSKKEMKVVSIINVICVFLQVGGIVFFKEYGLNAVMLVSIGTYIPRAITGYFILYRGSYKN